MQGDDDWLLYGSTHPEPPVFLKCGWVWKRLSSATEEPKTLWGLDWKQNGSRLSAGLEAAVLMESLEETHTMYGDLLYVTLYVRACCERVTSAREHDPITDPPQMIR